MSNDDELLGKLLGAVAKLDKLPAVIERIETTVGELRDEVRGSKDDSCGRLESLEVRVGKMETGLSTLKGAVDELFEEIQKVSRFVHGLSCVEEATCPDIPINRKSLASMSDDEPDSVLTREASFHAGPIGYRGPGVIGILAAVLAVVAAFLSHKYLGVP